MREVQAVLGRWRDVDEGGWSCRGEEVCRGGRGSWWEEVGVVVVVVVEEQVEVGGEGRSQRKEEE